MVGTADSAGNQGSDRSETPNVHVVSMARVMLGKSADCDEDSFVKGYEKGFDAGWSFGYRKALEEGRRQGRAEVEDEFKQLADNLESAHTRMSEAGIRDPFRATTKSADALGNSAELSQDTPAHSSGAICFLSDVVLEQPGRPSTNGNICLLSDVAISPIRDEDVFYDAVSSFSAESEDLLDIFYDAEQHVVASNSSVAASAEGETSNTATEPSSRSVTPPEREEEDLLDLSYSEAEQQTSALSALTNSTDSRKAIADSLAPAPHSSSTITALAPLPQPNTHTNTDTTNILTTDSDTSWIPRPRTKPWMPTLDPNIKTFFNIPLPHTLEVGPISPVTTWSIPLSARRPRPAYPALSGANIYALAREGRTIVEDPWRVLIGPLSEAARDAWKGDSGKTYLRGKLGVCTPYGKYRSSAGYRGGGGRGNWGYGNVSEGGHGEDTGGGVAFCQMVTDEEGGWYILVMFESQEKAREAERLFWGYPCGGSIMWAWFYREAE